LRLKQFGHKQGNFIKLSSCSSAFFEHNIFFCFQVHNKISCCFWKIPLWCKHRGQRTY
jgi:hypothetical protein